MKNYTIFLIILLTAFVSCSKEDATINEAVALKTENTENDHPALKAETAETRTITVIIEDCIGCGACLQVAPGDILVFDENSNKVVWRITGTNVITGTESDFGFDYSLARGSLGILNSECPVEAFHEIWK